MIHWEILIVWCLESTRRKQSLLSMLCQIGWFVSNQTGSHMEWALRQTPQHHWASKTHWNISLYPKIFPHIPNSFTKLYQAKIDTNRHWQTTGDSFLHVWLSQYGAKPPFWQNLERQKNSPGTFETSKYQNLPMYHFQKWLGFAIFCEFDTCHKEITIDSLVGSPCSPHHHHETCRQCWHGCQCHSCHRPLQLESDLSPLDGPDQWSVTIVITMRTIVAAVIYY